MASIEETVRRLTPGSSASKGSKKTEESTRRSGEEYDLMSVGDTVSSLIDYADWCLEKRGYNGGTYRDKKAFETREFKKWRKLRGEGYSQVSASALSAVLPDVDDQYRSSCSELVGLLGVGALPESDVEDVASLAGLDADIISRAHIYRGDPLSIADNLGRGFLASGALDVASMNPDAAWYFGGVAALHGAQTGVRSYFERRGKHLPSVASWLSSPSAMIQGAGVALSYPFRRCSEEADFLEGTSYGGS